MMIQSEMNKKSRTSRLIVIYIICYATKICYFMTKWREWKGSSYRLLFIMRISHESNCIILELYLDRIPLWGSMIIAFGAGTIAGIVVRVAFVPWQRKKIIGMSIIFSLVAVNLTSWSCDVTYYAAFLTSLAHKNKIAVSYHFVDTMQKVQS